MRIARHVGFSAMLITLSFWTSWPQQQPSPVVTKGQGPSVSTPVAQSKPPSESAEEPFEAIEKMTHPELRYRLIDRFGSPWYCDPDSYPVARGPREEASAIRNFPAIQQDVPAFRLIAKHLNLPQQGGFTTQEKLFVYREFKKVQRAIQLDPDDANFKFALSVPQKHAGSYRAKGFRITGRLDSHGEFIETQRTPTILACPL